MCRPYGVESRRTSRTFCASSTTGRWPLITADLPLARRSSASGGLRVARGGMADRVCVAIPMLDAYAANPEAIESATFVFGPG